MWLIRAALRRPITVVVAVVAVALAAVFAVSRMRADIFPGPRSAGHLRRAAVRRHGARRRWRATSPTTTSTTSSTSPASSTSSRSRSRTPALMKLQFHPGTDMSEAMARDDRLREPRARLHAAGHRRRRSSCGSTPARVPVGYLVFSSETPQPRRDPGPRAQPGAAAVRDAAGRLRAAALRRQPAHDRDPRRSRPAARVRHVARRSRSAPSPPAT